MRKKLRTKGGFTLTELLVAVALLGLLLAVMGAATPAALQAYRRVTANAEASILCATLTTAVADELRFAQNPRQEGDTAYFDSAQYGPGASFHVVDGRAKLGSYDLLGGKSYTSNLKIEELTVEYTSTDGRFTVKLTIADAENTALATTETLSVDPLHTS